VVEQVRFIEGQEVKKGDVLAEIELARYQLAVRSAQAALERAKAAQADAQAALERRESVTGRYPGLIPGEEVAAVRTRAATAEAEARAAQVALEQAQLNLQDARVRAPIGGIMQTRTVQTGQYVQPGTVLGTLLRREPLLLRFSVPEDGARRLTLGQKVAFSTRDASATFQAKVSHIGGAAEDVSRLVPVTAEVLPEDAEKLRPGTFAEVNAAVGSSGNAPVVPQTAVRASEKGFLAYVVEGDKARERVVQLGMRTPEGLVEVKQGLKDGDLLVVRGAEALQEGSSVRVAEEPQKPAANEVRSESGERRMGL
jgi:multidrug efflux system membrane fusion protein